MRITPTYPELISAGAAELTLGDRVSGLDPLVRRAQEGDAGSICSTRCRWLLITA